MSQAQAQTQAVSRPAVAADEASQPFFDAAARNELALLRCNACGTWQHLGATICTNCLSEDLSWAATSGRGTVHTFGIMHQLYHPGFATEVPYNLAIVELDEGPRLQTNIVGCANEDIVVGMAVKVIFDDTGDAKVPKFEPA